MCFKVDDNKLAVFAHTVRLRFGCRCGKKSSVLVNNNYPCVQHNMRVKRENRTFFVTKKKKKNKLFTLHIITTIVFLFSLLTNNLHWQYETGHKKKKKKKKGLRVESTHGFIAIVFVYGQTARVRRWRLYE